MNVGGQHSWAALSLFRVRKKSDLGRHQTNMSYNQLADIKHLERVTTFFASSAAAGKQCHEGCQERQRNRSIKTISFFAFLQNLDQHASRTTSSLNRKKASNESKHAIFGE